MVDTMGPESLGRSMLSEHRFETDLDAISPRSGIYMTAGRVRPRSAPPRRPLSANPCDMIGRAVGADLTAQEVDLLSWRQNKDFTCFLFGADFTSSSKLNREVRGCAAAAQTQQSARCARATGGHGSRPAASSRLQEYNQRKRLRMKAEADRHRMAVKLDDFRRADLRELFRCVKYTRNALTHAGAASLTSASPPDCHAQAAVTALACLAATAFHHGDTLRRVKRVAVAAALCAAATPCIALWERRRARPPATPSEIVTARLMEAGSFSSRRRYRFRPMTGRALKPRTVPPPHPLSAQRAVEREKQQQQAQGGCAAGPVFSIGPVGLTSCKRVPTPRTVTPAPHVVRRRSQQKKAAVSEKSVGGMAVGPTDCVTPCRGEGGGVAAGGKKEEEGERKGGGVAPVAGGRGSAGGGGGDAGGGGLQGGA